MFWGRCYLGGGVFLEGTGRSISLTTHRPELELGLQGKDELAAGGEVAGKDPVGSTDCI